MPPVAIQTTFPQHYKSINFKSFSNIKVCQRILGTLPVTTCTCERSFCSMRRLKTYTRNTMISERLNGIALMHVLPIQGNGTY